MSSFQRTHPYHHFKQVIGRAKTLTPDPALKRENGESREQKTNAYLTTYQRLAPCLTGPRRDRAVVGPSRDA